MNSALNTKIGEIVKHRRIKLDLTQDGVAEMIDVTPGFIGQVERAETSLSLENLSKLIRVLALDTNDLFSNEDSVVPDDKLSELSLNFQQLKDEDRELILMLSRYLLTRHAKDKRDNDSDSDM